MLKSKLKDKQGHFQKEPPGWERLAFPVLDQNADVPEALSATHPNIPAGRPSEKSRRANKHINNTTEDRDEARPDRDGQAPHNSSYFCLISEL